MQWTTIRSYIYTATFMLIVLITFSQAVHAAPALQQSDCIIPPSGPWPACARGGGGSWQQPSAHQNDDCIIPPSGPWPACARDSGGWQPPTPSYDDHCVIPPSGKWPPCATNNHPIPSTVYEFTYSPSDARPGESITLIWKTNFDVGVRIEIGEYPVPGHGYSGQPPYDVHSSLPQSGRLTMTLPPIGCFSSLRFNLLQANENREYPSRAQINIPYEQNQWVFDTEYTGTSWCPAAAQQDVFAEQRFEHGMMFWSQSADIILVKLDQNDSAICYRWQFTDTFDPTYHPVQDVSIEPPPEMYQPINGFGKLWRENQLVRDALGWAVSDEVVFHGYRQHRTHIDSSFGYRSGGDGFVWLFEYPWGGSCLYVTKLTIANP